MSKVCILVFVTLLKPKILFLAFTPMTMRIGRTLVERAETFVTCSSHFIKVKFCDSLSDYDCGKMFSRNKR